MTEEKFYINEMDSLTLTSVAPGMIRLDVEHYEETENIDDVVHLDVDLFDTQEREAILGITKALAKKLGYKLVNEEWMT